MYFRRGQSKTLTCDKILYETVGRRLWTRANQLQPRLFYKTDYVEYITSSFHRSSVLNALKMNFKSVFCIFYVIFTKCPSVSSSFKDTLLTAPPRPLPIRRLAVKKASVYSLITERIDSLLKSSFQMWPTLIMLQGNISTCNFTRLFDQEACFHRWLKFNPKWVLDVS